MKVEKNVRLALVKEEWSEEDEERVHRTIRGEYARTHKENEQAIHTVQ